jgi:hypothetical protein
MMPLKKKNSSNSHFLYYIHLITALFSAAALKLWLLVREVVPFNSDEAIVGLMARHILQGARPIFFYGQAYMGSLDAWFVAAGFWLFGEHVWVIRLVQGVLYLGVIFTTAKIGEFGLGSRRVGIIAAWLLAIPNVIVTLYSTVSLGGYGEALLLGNLTILLGLKISANIKRSPPVTAWLYILWGFMVGLGLWIFGLSLVFSIPMGLFLLLRFGQSLSGYTKTKQTLQFGRLVGLIGLGTIIGAAPWWLFALQNGFEQLLRELGGSAVAVEQGPWIWVIFRHLSNFILFGGTAVFGLRPSWEIRWLGLQLLPIILAFWVGVLVFIGRRLRSGQKNRFGAGILVGLMLTLAVGFIFTSFGVDPSGRYFVPLVIPLALFAAEMIIFLVDEYGRWLWGLVAVVIIYQFWGVWQSTERFPPGLTTQFNAITQIDHRDMDELAQFLRAEDYHYGYTNYWVSYPLAFETAEEFIFIPRLPYHNDLRYTGRDDRYQPYAEIVDNAPKIAYITTHNPTLDEILETEFQMREISWELHQIGDYKIYYHLSDLIRPEDMGLGLASP